MNDRRAVDGGGAAAVAARRVGRRAAVGLASVVLGGLAAASVLAAAGDVERVSVASDGSQALGASSEASISADGRFVAFTSAAANLVPGDTNGAVDVFVRDRQTGTTERVSVGAGGAQAAGGSIQPAISADGRFVAFTSGAALVAPDDVDFEDVYMHDRQTGATELVSVGAGGVAASRESSAPAISADGRFVAFQSAATNLAGADDTNDRVDVYVRDRQTSTTRRVSVASDGAQAIGGHSGEPALSADGRLVAFESEAPNLVAADTNDALDVFVHDSQTATTERVSVGSGGAQGSGTSVRAAISADGRLVAFQSQASDLVEGDGNARLDVFVRDRQVSLTRRVSVASDGAQAIDGHSREPALSGDGRLVAFESEAANLVAGDSNRSWDVFVHDLETAATTRASVTHTGAQATGGAFLPALSGDGRFVAFESPSTEIVPGDTNNQRDVFVHELGGAQAQTNRFTGTLSNDWNTAGNWSLGHAPTAAEDVAIGDGLMSETPVLSAGADGAANSIELARGSSLTVRSGRTLAVDGGADSSLAGNLTLLDAGTRVELAGTTDWSGGLWSINSGTTLANAGTLNMSVELPLFLSEASGSGLLHNTGRLARTGDAPGAGTIATAVDNDGTITVVDGRELQLTGGSGGEVSGGDYVMEFVLFAPGRLTVAGSHALGPGALVAGGAIRFGAGTFTVGDGADYRPATSELSGGTLALTGAGAQARTSGRITSNGTGGTRTGDAPLAVSGAGATSTLDNVTFRGGGTTTWNSAAAIAATGNLTLLDAGTRVELDGTVNWSGGLWSINTDTTLQNAGALNMSVDLQASEAIGGGLLHNTGTLARTGGAGAGAIATPLDNDGTVEVPDGRVLALTGGSGGQTSGGDYSIRQDAVLAVAGAHTLGAGASLIGAGAIRFDAGTFVVGDGADYAPQTSHFSGGTLSLTGTGSQTSRRTFRITSDGTGGTRTGDAPLAVATASGLPGSTLDNITFRGGGTTAWTSAAQIAATGNLSLLDADTRVELNGTVDWSGGLWSINTDTTLQNRGTLNMSVDLLVSEAIGGGLLHNTGTLVRTGGPTGAGAIATPLDNDGTVEVSGPRGLRLTGGSGGRTSSGSYSTNFDTAGSGAVLTVAGDHTLGAGARVTGDANIRFDSGTFTVGDGADYAPGLSVFSGGTLSLIGAGTGPRTTGEIRSDGTGGTRTGQATLEVTSAFTDSTLDKITFRGGGTTRWTDSGARIEATGPLTLLDAGTRVELRGTTDWSDGPWTLASGTTLENAGALNMSVELQTTEASGAGLLHNTGTLTRTGGATGAGTIAVGVRNEGTIRVPNNAALTATSVIQEAGAIEVGLAATFGGAGGTLTLNGGALRGGGGALQRESTVRGAVSNLGGTVEPGASPGILTIDGSYSQGTGGTLAVELAGTTAGSGYDRLAVTGSAALDGTLEIFTDPGFDPAPGQSFQVLTAAPRSGQFATVEDPAARGYDVGYGPSDVTLTASGIGVSIGDALVTEGDSGTTTVSFPVTLSEAASEPVLVDFATADGSATAPDDYQAASGTLTFAPGETEKAVAVEVQGDTLREPDETFTVELSKPAGARIVDGQATGRITDDDAQPSLSIGDVTVSERDPGGTASFPVTLSEPASQPVSVDFATADGSATAPDDYEAASGTLTFSPGQDFVRVTVPIKDDSLVESDETFDVELQSPANAKILDGRGTGTIADDDAPRLSIGDVTVTEGDSGATTVSFTVSLSPAWPQTVRVEFATEDETANAAGDYTAASGMLTFQPGDTAETVTVQVQGDTLDEPDETFAVRLERATNATILDGRGTGTITNDDGPGLAIGDVTVTEGDSGAAAASFTAALSGPSSQTVTVDFATADVTATTPSDYAAASGTLTFAPGDTQETVAVQVQGDTRDEPNETFDLNLQNAVNATIVDGRGRGTITDDDAAPSLSIGDVSVTEADSGATPGSFTASLSAPSGRAVTVEFATADGTATAPDDYAAASGLITFEPGDTREPFTIGGLVQGDRRDEPDETFNVNLRNASNATIADGEGTVTVEDDDLPPLRAFRTANVVPVSGVVLVRRRAVRASQAARLTRRRVPRGFVPLSDAAQIRIGTVINADRGVVRIQTAANRTGTRTQTAKFGSGTFRIRQPRARRPVTELALTGSRLRACKRRGPRVRRLSADGRGAWRIKGRHSSAMARGRAAWLVKDTCKGTRTRVRRGSVRVRDFVRRRTVRLRAPRSYFAASRRPSDSRLRSGDRRTG